MFDSVIDHIRKLHNTDGFVPLHEPCFAGNEKRYLNECIDSTFVSSVGKFVEQFEGYRSIGEAAKRNFINPPKQKPD